MYSSLWPLGLPSNCSRVFSLSASRSTASTPYSAALGFRLSPFCNTKCTFRGYRFHVRGSLLRTMLPLLFRFAWARSLAKRLWIWLHCFLLADYARRVPRTAVIWPTSSPPKGDVVDQASNGKRRKTRWRLLGNSDTPVPAEHQHTGPRPAARCVVHVFLFWYKGNAGHVCLGSPGN